MKFKKGQKVVCIDDTKRELDLGKLTKGDIYTVRELRGDEGIYLVEIVPPSSYGGYRCDRFVTVIGGSIVDENHTLSEHLYGEGELDFDFSVTETKFEDSRRGIHCVVKLNNKDILATSSVFCSEKDIFSYEFGKKLALKRVLKTLTENYNLSKEHRSNIWEEFQTMGN